VIDFVAVEAGTYEIRCAKLCGMGHGRMKGKLIVEELVHRKAAPLPVTTTLVS